ncbi:hypothetical protein PPYR_11074 [Photinus pyralis]|uniref:Spaetzle domain-containing protein n=2 Tax=Photinus pyralis TaxID=7054 RepID=A0A5N4AI95_PHOPY|nr:uncharacterized protein LOC116175134 [Photinus pyralis]KAB0797013.1 hypothetical protein PPYR_11074 [Photinus pyralis]
MSRMGVFNCILIISILKSISLSSGDVLKPSRNPFKIFNEYNEKPKADLSLSKFEGNAALERAVRNMGENIVICEVSISKEELFEDGYEFYPNEYVNETCRNTNIDPFVAHTGQHLKPVICLHNDNKFGCETLYEEKVVWKKSTKGKKECVEHTSQLVAVGCKCNIRFDYNYLYRI